MHNPSKTLTTAEMGSKKLLDAVERSMDQGMGPKVFDRVMAARPDAPHFDLTGEVIGEAYWRNVAGEPNPSRAVWPTADERKSRKREAEGEYSLPTIVVDRHRKPGVRRESKVAA